MDSPSTPGASHTAATKAQRPRRFQHQRPAGAELSTHSALLLPGVGNRTTDSEAAGIYLPPGQSETVSIRMAPKSVGLFVLLQLLALNVVSHVSAFPTPTASADGELPSSLTVH